MLRIVEHRRDDARTARAAEHEENPAVLFDQGRRHRRERPDVELRTDVFDINPPLRPLQGMMADRALHRRTASAQHPNSERLDREPGPDDPAVAG